MLRTSKANQLEERLRKPKLRELKEAVRAFVKGPYTTKFPKVPSIPPETFRGKPKYDEDGCVGCGACAQVCPSAAIELIDERGKGATGTRKLALHYDRCIFCGQCQANCITDEGIKLSLEYDLATYDRTETVESVEKELLFCEFCGAPITTVDHLKWLAKKLGPLAFSNQALILVSHKELSLVDKTAPRDKRPAWRTDYMRILCPKCRREVIFTEEWGA